MAMHIDGVEQLLGDITRMANALDTDGEGAQAGKRILEAAAAPIHAQMKANTLKDPKRISGKLHDAIKTGKVKRYKLGGQRITIGVHRKDWNAEDDYYPAYTEYGHGGPGPAPPHPYIRPAYDTRQDEAYSVIRDGLLNELRKT